MPSEDPMFNEAMAALGQGDTARARDLLTRLLKTDQNNPDYWLYMSAVVETAKERVYCLKEVLRRDSQNQAARRGLALLGALPADELPRPAPVLRRNWQKALSIEPERIQAPRGRQVLMIAAGLLGLAVLVFLGLYGARYLSTRRQQAQALRLPTLAVTVPAPLTPTATATRPGLPAGPTGTPAPLWMMLSATYTPTPVYINTPHPRTEAYRSAMRAYADSDWNNMLSYLQQVATAEPSSADVAYYLGEVYRQQEKYPQAIEAFTQSINLDSKFAPPHLGLARVLAVDQPDAETVIETNLQDAIRYDPNLAEAYLELASFYLQKSDPRSAFAILEKGAPVLGQSSLFYELRARAYLQAKQPDKAVEDARQANTLDVTRLETYLLLGEVLQANNDLSGSLKPLQTYIQYVSDDPQALVMLGQAYAAAGQEEPALDAFSQVLAINKGYVAVYLARGDIYLNREEGQKALDDFETALRFKGDSFDANLGKGRALLLMGYNGDAYMQISRSEGFARSEAEQARMHYWRALALESLKERDPNSGIAAINDWKALLALPQDAYPAAWASQAEEHIQALYTVTPTPRPTATASTTPTAALTRTPTATLTTAPSRTPTATAVTPSSAVLSVTPTRKP